MRTTLFTFLILLLVICLQLSCQRDIEPLDKQMSISYVDSLYKQADQLEASNKIDAALHTNFRALRLIENRSDSTYGKVLRQRITLFGSKRPLDSAFYYSNKLFLHHQSSRDSSGIADAFYLKAFYFNKTRQMDSALFNAYKSVEIYKRLNDSSKVYHRSRLLTLILKTFGNYEEAERVAVESLHHLKNDSANNEKFSNIYNDIAILTKKRGNLDEALYWYQKALKLTAIRKNQITIKNNIAVTHIENRNYEKAYDILSDLRADSIVEFSKELRYKSRILNNWAFAKSKLGHPDAEAYLLEALEMRKQENIAYRLNGSYVNLAIHYADRLDSRAVEMARLAYETAKTYNNPDDQLNALSILVETAASPREYAMQYISLSDSIHDVRQQNKSDYAKIRFDVEHNRQENENLKAKAIIQDLEVTKAESNNIILILLVFIILGGGYLLYKYLNKKHKKEKELAAYEAELYISKKVHDEVANDVFNLLTRIQKDTLSPSFKPTLLGYIDKLYRKTRNIARDYSDIPAGAAFIDTLNDLLSNYNNDGSRVLSKGIKEISWVDFIENKQRTLYRILQELLINMKKHSGASLVMFNFQKIDNQLVVEYSDNGSGISKEKLDNGHGIKNMGQRLEGIGGKISFGSPSTSGAKATIKIPF